MAYSILCVPLLARTGILFPGHDTSALDLVRSSSRTRFRGHEESPARRTSKICITRVYAWTGRGPVTHTDDLQTNPISKSAPAGMRADRIGVCPGHGSRTS